MTSRKIEYKSKVTVDTGLTRGRVPCQLLRKLGARPGDYLIFPLASSDKAVVRVSRATEKSSKGKSK